MADHGGETCRRHRGETDCLVTGAGLADARDFHDLAPADFARVPTPSRGPGCPGSAGLPTIRPLQSTGIGPYAAHAGGKWARHRENSGLTVAATAVIGEVTGG